MTRIGVVAQPVDERASLAVEAAHLALHVDDEAIDRDEQGELTVAQCIENLAVITACPDRVAVGHQAQPGDVFAGFDEEAQRTPDAGKRQSGVEE